MRPLPLNNCAEEGKCLRLEKARPADFKFLLNIADRRTAPVANNIIRSSQRQKIGFVLKDAVSFIERGRKGELERIYGVSTLWQDAIGPFFLRQTTAAFNEAGRFMSKNYTKTEKGNPEGWPLIRAAYRPWWFQKRIQEIEGIGVERDLAGLPIVTPPDNLSYDLWNTSDSAGVAMKATILKLIKSIRRDTHEGVLMPQGYTMELMSSGGARQFDTGAIITRYSGEILMSMLADVLQLGQAKVGTQALGKTKAQMFYSSLDGILDSATEVLNRHGATRLWRANGWPMDQMAKFTHGSATPADIEGLAEYINKLSGLITPNVTLERHLLQQANLPEAEEGLDVLDDERREDERAEREIQREINTQQLAGMNQGVLEPGEEE